MINNIHDRKGLTVDDLFKKEHYRSIIVLTGTYDKGDGLRAIHYRWRLIKNHDGIKQTYFKKMMKKDFHKFHNLYLAFPPPLLSQSCITSKTNLAYFLNRLIKLDILKENQIEGIKRYSLAEKGKTLLIQEALIKIIKKMDLQGLEEFIERITSDTILNKYWLATKGVWKNIKDKK